MFLFAPSPVEVVVLHGAGLGIAHNRVLPIWKLNAQPRGFGIEQPDGLVLGRSELKTNAGGPYCLLVPYFCFYLNNVAQGRGLL